MDNRERETYYLVSQEDAFRIEGLISTLAMAIWEILRTKEITLSPPEYPEDATIAQNMFAEETRRILTPKDNAF